MAKSNLLRRKEGNFEPKEPYIPNDKKDSQRAETTSVAKTAKHQLGKRRKNIKVSEEMKNAITAIKTIKGFSYDYEAIGLLIDFYMENENESNKRKYKMFMDIHN